MTKAKFVGKTREDAERWASMQDFDLPIGEMPYYTVRRVAEMLRVAGSTVTLHLRQMGAKREGRDWVIDEQIIRVLRDRIQQRPGRPKTKP
jgi:hypothetical protein